VLVYRQLLNTLFEWVHDLYGIDDYIYPWNTSRQFHPPGLYTLINFYEQGSKYYLAQLNF